MKNISIIALVLASLVCFSMPAYAVNQPPHLGTLTPSSGSSQINQAVTFTATYTDANGSSDIRGAFLLINSVLSGSNGLYARYDRTANSIYILDDKGANWLGGYVPGSNKIIENSYGKIDCSKTTVSSSGTTLTIKWSATFKNTFTGTKNIYMCVQDMANATDGWTQKGTWTVGSGDVVPPTGTIVINGGATYTKSAVVTLTLSATDAGSGMGQGAQMQFSNDNVTWSTAEAYVTTKSWTLKTGDGQKTVYTKFRDVAGNWSSIYSSSITLVTIIPSIITQPSALTLNPGQRATFTVVATSAAPLTYQWKKNSTAITGATSSTYVISSVAAADAASYTVTVTNIAGPVTSSAVSLTVTVNPPTGSIKINNDQQYTNSLNVTLNLSATAGAGGSSISQMKFSNDNSNWSVPEAYKQTKTWTLTSGDGTKTVYVRFSDNLGNWSVVYSDSIILDTTPPAIVITSPSNGATVNSSNLTVTYTVDGVAKTKQFTLVIGQNTVSITETDAAGNVGSVSISVTYVVTTLPSIVTTNGYRLMVQKRLLDNTLAPAAPYTVKGVNWSPTSKDTTGPEVNETDMRNQLGHWCDIDIPLIKNMNANTIRTFQDFGLTGDAYEKDWKYILDKCYANGIMVIVTVDRCIDDTNRIQQIVNTYKNHPAVLMWLVGNEWTIPNQYGKYFYGTYDDIYSAAAGAEAAATLIKTLDTNHPVLTSVGDLDYPSFDVMKDIIINRCPDVDVWGFNLYRGRSFNNLFDQWNDIGALYKKKPLLITEFGCDAYDSNINQEDQVGQRTCEYYQWADLAKNLSADDPTRTSAGGCVFEFNDEWWKVRGTAGTHDTGGWSTNNCPDGFASEEWWGLVDIDRNPRLAYQLFKEYFGGLVPTPPPADAQEDYGVVRFSNQPSTITTNIATYTITDVFKDATEISVNGQVITPDYYNGFVQDVSLKAGANNLTLHVKFKDTTESTYQKTVIYDPGYSTAAKKLIYVNDIVIDLDAGAVLGRLPVTATAVTHNGNYFLDSNGNVYSTATNQPAGKKLNVSGSSYQLLSYDDKRVYTANRALDFSANSILTDSLPVSIQTDYCSTDSSGYIYYAYRNVIKKIDPTTFAVVKDAPNTNYDLYGSCVSKDGSTIVGDYYGYASGVAYVVDVATLATTTIDSLSDYVGDVFPSNDDAKMFVGTYGNSYYGKGGVYVIDKSSKALNSFYHQFGARRITASPDYLFATSIVVDHFHSIGQDSSDGQIVQGSIFHRGIEVLKLNAQSVLEYQKSFFLGLSHDYSMPVKLFYKKAN